MAAMAARGQLIAARPVSSGSLCLASKRSRFAAAAARFAQARPSARLLAIRRSDVTAATTVVTPRKTMKETFAQLKRENRAALIPFICAGDPDLETTKQALLILDRTGADVIELGVPYSDPLADGPTIQAAATRALEKHTTLDKVIKMLAEVSGSMTTPVVMFTYYNPIMARGQDKFMADVKAAGAAGILVPDIPLEETGPIRAAATAAGLETVLLVTPTTPKERMRKIAAVSEGFVYLVSVTGVTGIQATIQARVQGLIADVRAVTDKPVAVGFGVSGGEQAEQLVRWGADGVIAGSAFVKALGEAGSPTAGLQRLEALAVDLRAGCDRGRKGPGFGEAMEGFARSLGFKR